MLKWRGAAVLAATVVCWAALAAGEQFLVPQYVSHQLLRQQLYLRELRRENLRATPLRRALDWQNRYVHGKQKQLVHAWIRWRGALGYGGAQILGSDPIEFEGLALEVSWPQVKWLQGGAGMKALLAGEGRSELWPLAGPWQRVRGSRYSLRVDLGPAAGFSSRRITWTAHFVEYRYEPPETGTPLCKGGADHRYVILAGNLELTTNGDIAPGTPVKLRLRIRQRRPVRSGFILSRVAAFWQSATKAFVHVPAYPGTSYWSPAPKGLQEPYLLAWLFPKRAYKAVIIVILGFDRGPGPLSTESLLRAGLLDWRPAGDTTQVLSASAFGHSRGERSAMGPAWFTGLDSSFVDIGPSGAISPVRALADSLVLKSAMAPQSDPTPRSLEEAVSWDEELFAAVGGRIAYAGILTGGIDDAWAEWARLWVQRVHSRGFKAAVGWNCVEVPMAMADETVKSLAVGDAERQPMPLATNGGPAVALVDWLSPAFERWAAGTIERLRRIGFDYVLLDQMPIDAPFALAAETQDAPLYATAGTLPDAARQVSLSTGNPGFFSALAARMPGRVFAMASSDAVAFSQMDLPLLGPGAVVWNPSLTERSAWAPNPKLRKTIAFERWCQMAAFNLAFPGIRSDWLRSDVGGLFSYLGPGGMEILRRYTNLIGRMISDCSGLALELQARSSTGAPVYARAYLPEAWAEGRLYVVVASDQPTVAEIDLPTIAPDSRYMVCDLLSLKITAGQGPLRVVLNPQDNIVSPFGAFRALVVQRLRR